MAASVTVRAQQQGQRLKRLRERTGVSKGLLMDRLGFRTSMAYDLYERGVSVIRLDRLDDWAEAFGLSTLAFVAEVVYGEADPELRRRAAEALGPAWAEAAPETVDVMAEELARLPPAERDRVLAQIADQRPGHA